MTSQPLRNRSRWSLDYSRNSKTNPQDLPCPPGFSTSINALHAEASRQSDATLKAKRSWDLALGPIKQAPMNVFIMYMSGNTISIVPITMVIMMMIGPVKTLFNINTTFKALDNIGGGGMQNIGQKIVYVIGNLANIALAMWKCHGMGLLPTHASDWLAFADPVLRAEWAYA